MREEEETEVRTTAKTAPKAAPKAKRLTRAAGGPLPLPPSLSRRRSCLTEAAVGSSTLNRPSHKEQRRAEWKEGVEE
jgi:hypothetical protein